MQGRLHGYEGYTAQEVAFPVWLMARLGAGTLITTNAAGAINESYRVGDFCIMTDQLNFTGRNPITGTEPAAMAPRFFSMLDAYDPALRQLARQTARGAGHSRAGGRLPGPARPLLRDAGGDSDVPLLGRRHRGHVRVRGGHRGAPCGNARARHLARKQHGLRAWRARAPPTRRCTRWPKQEKPTSAGLLRGFFSRYSAFRS